MIVQVELPDGLAWALTEFLKRVGYSDVRPLAVDEQEARDMLEAGEKVRVALAEKGIVPR
jgi:hypothetical protein